MSLFVMGLRVFAICYTSCEITYIYTVKSAV